MVKDLDILQSNMSGWDVSCQWSFYAEMIYEWGLFHCHVWLPEGIVHALLSRFKKWKVLVGSACTLR